jgi:hypothetical protein
VIDDSLLNESGEQVETPLGKEANDLPDDHPEDQGPEPDDPPCCPAAEQAGSPDGDEDDDPLAQFKAWRRRVASYALKIKTGVLPTQVDDLLRRLRGKDTQSPVTREEVEAVVSALTRTIMGGTAPKKHVESKKKRSYKGRTNHVARKRILYAR